MFNLVLDKQQDTFRQTAQTVTCGILSDPFVA